MCKEWSGPALSDKPRRYVANLMSFSLNLVGEWLLAEHTDHFCFNGLRSLRISKRHI